MWVIPPGEYFEGEAYRVAEYAGYFRYVKGRVARAVQNGGGNGTYPEPVPHCDVCRWFRECDEQRRGDDHLSLVAGIRRQQREQLVAWDTETMAKLAVLPIPLEERPKHRTPEANQTVGEPARGQMKGRSKRSVGTWLLVAGAGGHGVWRMPVPSA